MKHLTRVFIITSLTVTYFSCAKAAEEIPVSSLSLNLPSAEMVVGETTLLTATVLPTNATDKTRPYYLFEF